MAEPIKVGSGYIPVTPRLDRDGLDKFRLTLMRQMETLGRNASNSLSTGLLANEGKMRTAGRRMGRAFEEGMVSSTRATSAALRELNTATARLGPELRRITTEARTATAVQEQLAASMTAAAAAADRQAAAQARLARAETEGAVVTTRHTSSLHAFATGAVAAGHGITRFVSGPLLALGVGVVDVSVKFGDLRNRTIAAIAAFQGQDAAVKMVDTLDRMSKTLPVSIDDMYKLARILSSLETNVAPVTDEVHAMSNAIAAHHLNTSQANRAMIQFEHMLMGVSINSKELNTLTMDGIPAWDLMSRATGKNIEQLKKMSKEGNLLSKDVMPKLIHFLNTDETYTKSAAAANESLQGSWLKLTNVLKVGLGSNEKTSESVTRLAESVSKFADALDSAMPFLTVFAARVIDVFSMIIGWVSKFAVWFSTLPKNVQNAIGKTVIAIALLGPAILILGQLAHAIIGIIVVSRGLGAAIAVMSGPVGWVIAAIALVAFGIYELYQKNKTFRDFCQRAWVDIQQAVWIAWAQYIKPAFFATRDFIRNDLAPATLWFWQNVVVPAWNGISTAVSIAWSQYIKPAFFETRDFIMNQLVPATLWFWRNVIIPAWDGIAAAVMWAWRNVIYPVYDAFRVFIVDYLIPTVKDFWQSCIVPAWNGIGTVISVAWNDVIYPILRLFWSVIRNILWPGIQQFYSDVIKPTWDLIGWAIHTAWKVVIEPILHLFELFLKNILGPAIKWFYTDIVKPTWDGIGTAMSWTWDHVIKPVLDTFGSAILGLSNFFDKSKEAIKKTWGEVSDIVQAPIKAAINFINKELLGSEKNPNGGVNWVLDKLGIPTIPNIPGFATGGIVPGYAPGVDNYPAILSPGEAVLRPEVARSIGHSRILSWNADAVAGRPLRFAEGGIVPSAPKKRKGFDWNPIHWVQSAVGWAEDQLAKGAKFVWEHTAKPIVDGLDKTLAGTPLILSRLGMAPAHSVYNAVDKFLGGVDEKGSKGGGSGPAPTGQVKAWIDQAIGLTGVTPVDLWERGMGTIVQRESGGNPNVVNNWDSNAAAGTPSKGLAQVIWPTFAAYHQAGTSWDLLDPIANLAASINYIVARYGGIQNVQQANPNLPPKGYWRGGLVTSRTFAEIGERGPELILPLTDERRTDQLLRIAGLKDRSGHTVIVNAAPDVPSERQIMRALNTAALMNGF
ncbi:tape measure protein [Kitasatospora sp. NPDC127116]|uniref:tape measure protein n=1 Tax=Kitasatospora sp. NPDC127116 TaxID=3345367 RepID=UPI00362FD023